MDYNILSAIERIETTLDDIRGDLDQIQRDVRSLESAIPDYHPWFFILTILLAALLYRLW